MELLRITIPMKLAWRYSSGKYFGKFISMLKERKIFAVRCGVCRKVYLPPRPVCGNCFTEINDWLEVGPSGVLRGFTVGFYNLLDPSTGQPRKVPFGIGLIQLDGADTLLNHYIDETDSSKLRTGLRVEPLWSEKRDGLLTDILHFRVYEFVDGK